MTYQTNIKKHGGYRNLRSYKMTTVIFDLTVAFCKVYMTYKSNPSYRTVDQMIQAARSGRQNIAEGSQVSATSKKSEIKLVGVARASLEELLIDYEDFLRQRGLKIWDKDDPRAKEIRSLVYILDRQLQSLEKAFLEEGGYTENLYKRRVERRLQK